MPDKKKKMKIIRFAWINVLCEDFKDNFYALDVANLHREKRD